MGVSALFSTSTPIYSADVLTIDFAQTANVVYVAHNGYDPQKLTRNGHTDWTWASATFTSPITAPTGVSVTPNKPNTTGAIDFAYRYYVTAVDAVGNESVASTVAVASNDLSLHGNNNVVTWSAVTGAISYNVYRGENALPGYLGASVTTSFTDHNNLQAIGSDTPPKATNPFNGAGNKPGTVSFHQQRLWWGRTIVRPNAAFSSQTASFDNMDVSQPAKPDDAISFALVAQKLNSINQLASLKKDLIAFTADGIFTINGGEGGVLTPSAIVPELQTSRGGSRLKPIPLDAVLFYQPSKSSEVRTIGYSFNIDGYQSNNVAIFSSHFFTDRRIVSWAQTENPYTGIWMVLDNGEMLFLTWEIEQEVWGFAKMEIDGFVEQCAVITEQGYDRLYILVRREIGGVVKRFHERLALPQTDPTTACHLDCSVTRIFAEPSNVVDQLYHLEGESVSVHADGYAFENLVVANGRVTLPFGFTALVATVGFPYEGMLHTLPPALNTSQGSLNVEPQNIGEAVVRCCNAKGLEVSIDDENWEPLPEREGTVVSTDTNIEQRDYRAPLSGHWQEGVYLRIRQRQPFPAHITGVLYDLLVSTSD